MAAIAASVDEHALKRLLPFFGAKLLCDIRATNIAHYQAKHTREGAEGRTMNIEIGLLRGVLGSHRLWDSLSPDVHVLTEGSDAGRALTATEESALLEATRQTESTCNIAAVLALNTAMRKTKFGNCSGHRLTSNNVP